MFLLLSKTQKWFVLKTVAFVGLLDARLTFYGEFSSFRIGKSSERKIGLTD